MTTKHCSQIILGLAICLAGTTALAQSSGEAIYKGRCASCHGANGIPSAGLAKMLGIKPASDPEMKKLSVEQIESAVKNGKGKMKPVSGLSDAQIRAVADYFKTLK